MSTTTAPPTPNPNSPTLLTIPPELRNQIYEYVLAPTSFKPHLQQHLCRNWTESKQPKPAIPILLIGTYPKRGYRGPYLTQYASEAAEHITEAAARKERGQSPEMERDWCKDIREQPCMTPKEAGKLWVPWCIARVCRRVRKETEILLKEAIGNVCFEFHAFTVEDMTEWVRQMGEDRLKLVKRWSMEGVGWCIDPWFEYGEMGEITQPADYKQGTEDWYDYKSEGWWFWFEKTGYCHRSLTVDLTRFDHSGLGTPQATSNSTNLYIQDKFLTDQMYDLDACNHGNSELHSERIEGCEFQIKSEVEWAWREFASRLEESVARGEEGVEVVCTEELMVDVITVLIGREHDGREPEFDPEFEE